MDEESILKLLKEHYRPVDGTATYPGTYVRIGQDSLVAKMVGNRAAKGWPKAQFILAAKVKDSITKEACLEGWESVSKPDQYLFLEIDDDIWEMYDGTGSYKGDNSYIDNFIQSSSPKPLEINYKPDRADYIPSLLSAMRAKPFVLLAGISGTGKSRTVKQLAFDSCPENGFLRKDPTSPGNYCLVEVKPNWHDSTELLGYKSLISNEPKYIITPFIKFLARAKHYEDKAPFFLCLDEMNLAPVEQYFAEFLSVLESRKMIDGKITSEPLIPASVFIEHESSLKYDIWDLEDKLRTDQATYSSTVESAPLYGGLEQTYEIFKKEGLRIPSNLVVIGTVNMDETTHQFSRKVIDRAMTIEMNIDEGEEPFKNFFEDYKELGYSTEPLPKEVFLPSAVSAAEAMEELSDDDQEFLKEQVPVKLSELNTALKDTPFKVAYRVQNELILYFASLRLETPEEDAEALLIRAIDDIMMMKVLPRIEGDEDMLKQPLKQLALFCQDYKNSVVKIREMQVRLDRAHFTSFWP